MGAGGSALAISSHLTQEKFGDDVPSKIIIGNRSQPRLTAAEEKLKGIHDTVKFEYKLGPTAEDNDAILSELKPYSMVINAQVLARTDPVHH